MSYLECAVWILASTTPRQRAPLLIVVTVQILKNVGQNSGSQLYISVYKGCTTWWQIGQGESELWLQLRKGRITASCLKEIVLNPKKYAENLWKKRPNLENVKSIMWGKKHESDARKEYEQLYDCQVREVGLFISKVQPLVGASPDGIIDNGRGLL